MNKQIPLWLAGTIMSPAAPGDGWAGGALAKITPLPPLVTRDRAARGVSVGLPENGAEQSHLKVKNEGVLHSAPLLSQHPGSPSSAQPSREVPLSLREGISDLQLKLKKQNKKKN